LIPIIEAEKLVKFEGDGLSVDDIRLCLRNRVLFFILNLELKNKLYL
jgi:hypothetical protein